MKPSDLSFGPGQSPAGQGEQDDLVPYSSDAIRIRLGEHALTDDFLSTFLVASGGSLKVEDGGAWERVRRANGFLRQKEGREEWITPEENEEAA